MLTYAHRDLENDEAAYAPHETCPCSRAVNSSLTALVFDNLFKPSGQSRTPTRVSGREHRQKIPRQLQLLCNRPACVGPACYCKRAGFLVAHVHLQGTKFGTIIDVCRLEQAFELQYTDALRSELLGISVIEQGQPVRSAISRAACTLTVSFTLYFVRETPPENLACRRGQF